MRINRLALTTAAVLAAASPLMGQEHPHPAAQQKMAGMAAMHCGGGMAMMAEMHAGQSAMPGMMADSMRHNMMMDMKGGTMMMDMMGPPTPAMILNHKAGLGLSADQASRVEALQKRAETACAEHMRLAMESHHAADRLLEADSPDFTAYSAKMKEAAAHMAEGHIVMARAAVAARNVLTATQRQTLKDRMAQMHKRP